MIKFSLKCDGGHGFEAWFSRSGDFDDQSERGLVTCPQCGSSQVEKALMAPALSHGGTKAVAPADRPTLALDPQKAAHLEKLKSMVAAIKASSEDVGERFPDEARKIHYGESEARGIIGKADPKEARSLAEEGIAFAPLPHFPDDAN